MQQNSLIVNQKVHELPITCGNMIEVAHMLTSATKLKIFELLAEPTAPERIANHLDITRQGVDKHLKDFLKYGLVEKMWVLTSSKPRVEYKTTEMGRSFYKQITNVMENYRKKGNEELNSILKSLDLQFINGELEQHKYLERKQEIIESMAWFLEQ